MKDPSSNHEIWGVIPAAGMSRRMGFPKQTAMIRGSTMAATIAQNMLHAGVAGIVVVTRSELLSDLGLPRDKRIVPAINDDPDSEMMDSIVRGLSVLTGKRPPTRIDEEDVTIGSRVQSHIRQHTATPGFDRPASSADGIMVVPGDMPAISLASYKACVAAYLSSPNRIVIATCNGKPGHPIVFPFSMRAELSGLAGGLRMLPESYPERVVRVETADPGALQDVDTPDDLEIG